MSVGLLDTMSFIAGKYEMFRETGPVMNITEMAMILFTNAPVKRNPGPLPLKRSPLFTFER